MHKSKFLVAAILAGIVGFGAATGSAAGTAVKVIPYPAGLETAKEGASAAPQEINHSHTPYYSDEDVYNMTSTEGRVVLTHYPTYQQTARNTGGPATALTVLYWYGNQKFDEMTLAKEMGTQPYPIGTSVNSIAKFFRNIGWQVSCSLDTESPQNADKFKDFVLGYLRQNVPIMVENIAWGGHWRVIIGYDTMNTATTLDDVLILAESYDIGDHRQDGYNIESAAQFYQTWFDHNMLPENERDKPWVVARPNDKKDGYLFVRDLPQLRAGQKAQ